MLCIAHIPSLMVKNNYNKYPNFTPFTSLLVGSVAYPVYLFMYVYFTNPESLQYVLSPENRTPVKYVILASLFSTISVIYFAPLFKKMDYSRYKVYVGPISMLIAMIASIAVLGEKPDENTWKAFAAFMLAMYFSSRKNTQN